MIRRYLLTAAVPALALLAAACSDHPQGGASSANAFVTPTAPNVNNPYATDPLDPDMNPRYLRDVH